MVAVLDKSDKGGSGVNNNVYYDVVECRQGGDINDDYNGHGEYGSGSFASAFVLQVVVIFDGSLVSPGFHQVMRRCFT